MEKILKLFRNFIDFKNILFFWAIILYSDSYYLIFFHRSIENINYEYLKNSLNTINIEDIVSFVILFGISFIFFIPLIIFVFNILYAKIIDIFFKKNDRDDNSKSKYNKENEERLFIVDLYEYSLINDNKVAYEIYKNRQSEINRTEEFEKIISFVLFFSIIDYICGRYYDSGNCILNILYFGNTNILKDISQLLIIGYSAVMFYFLKYIFHNEYDSFSVLKIRFISSEIPSYINKNIKKFKSEQNLRKAKGKTDIIPKDFIPPSPPKK
jgi:hypothetical protein